MFVVLLVIGGGAYYFARSADLLGGLSSSPAIGLDESLPVEDADRRALDYVESGESMEARRFLEDPQGAWPKWQGTGNPKWFIENVYERGAIEVRVTRIETRGGRKVAGPLVVALPRTEPAHALLTAWLVETCRGRAQIGHQLVLMRYAE